MRYPHTVTIETPTTSSDGGGGQTVDGWTTVYSGRADVQDMQDLQALRDAGLEAQQLVTVFLPETESLSGISKRDRLTWNGASGLIHELSRLDNAFVAALDG
jgi:hypothetical protein